MNKVKTYHNLFPGELPGQLINIYKPNHNHQLINSNYTNIPNHSLSSSSSSSSTKIIENLIEKSLFYNLYLDCIENQIVCPIPAGWESVSFVLINKTQKLFGPKLIQISGAWFLTKFEYFNALSKRNKSLLSIGDSLRLGLIDPINETCRPYPGSDHVLNWSQAVEKGWISKQCLRALQKPIRIGNELLDPFGRHLVGPNVITSNHYNHIRKSNFLTINLYTGHVNIFNQNIYTLYKNGLLNFDDYHHICSILSNGMKVEMRDCYLNWLKSSSPISNINQTSSSQVIIPKPCLSDWIGHGAYNSQTRKLRVSVLNDDNSFVELELGIGDAIKEGLIDSTIPEFVVPFENSYKRINLNEAVECGILDIQSGLWNLPNLLLKNCKIGLDIVQTAGYLSRAPSLAELLMSGLILPNSSLTSGILDVVSGCYLSLAEAIKRGHVLGNQPSLILYDSSNESTQVYTLNEALDCKLLNSSCMICLDGKPSMDLWTAINDGLLRILYTELNPPAPGFSQNLSHFHKNSSKLGNHPIVRAIKDGLIDCESQEIKLSNLDAHRIGLNSNKQSVTLSKACQHLNLCDVQTIRYLTQPCGLIMNTNEKPKFLTGLEAIKLGYLVCDGNTNNDSPVYGSVIDPQTQNVISINSATKWPSNLRLNSNGVQLIMHLTSARPPMGYLMLQRIITRLEWSGPQGLIESKISMANDLLPIWSNQISAILNPIDQCWIGLEEAIHLGLIKLDDGSYFHPIHNTTCAILKAIQNGWILKNDKLNSKVSFNQFSIIKINICFKINKINLLLFF